MEGYFRAGIYAELEGIDYFTAMQRVHRKTVSSFKEPNTGNVYIYWSDVNSGPSIPKGFISIEKFRLGHGLGRSRVNRWIKKGLISESDIFKRTTRTGLEFIYIREDTEIPSEEKIPEGYLTAKEWGDKNGVVLQNVRNYIHFNKIHVMRHGGHVYIPENEPVPLDLRKYRKGGHIHDNEVGVG